MPAVQGSHGGHEAYAPAGRPRSIEGFTPRRQVAYNFYCHVALEPFSRSGPAGAGRQVPHHSVVAVYTGLVRKESGGRHA